MANLSEDIADLTISRQLVLQRVANGLAKDVAEHYTAMIDDIRTTILRSGNISNRLRQTIKDIKEQLSVPNFDKEFKDLAQQEVNYTQKAYNSVIGVDVFKNIPPESAMNAILSTSLIEGATVSAWLKDLEASQAFDVERAVKLGMTLGETNNQLAQRVVNTLGVSMRNAQTIVKTGTATVANQARMEFYDANDDVIKGYQWMATLDSRTRLEHAIRDGASWDTNKKGLNDKGKKYPFKYTPDGWNCRCQLVPILKTWREIGIDEDELPEGTRSSLDGYVPQTATFEQWLKTKNKAFLDDYLGKGRAELYQSGKITFSDLVRQDGRTLTIKELGAMGVPKVVKVPDISFGYGGKFDGYVKDIRPEAKMVIDRLPKPENIALTKNGRYNKDLKKLETTKEQSTFIHEYGHHIDANTQKVQRRGSVEWTPSFTSMTSFKEAYEADSINYAMRDIEKIKQLLTESGYSIDNKITHGISDIFDSFKNGSLQRLGYSGHGYKYADSDDLKRRETFANLFQLYSTQTKWGDAQKLFPNLTKEFEKTIKDILDGKFD